jgi:hypothetical protein
MIIESFDHEADDSPPLSPIEDHCFHLQLGPIECRQAPDFDSSPELRVSRLSVSRRGIGLEMLWSAFVNY